MGFRVDGVCVPTDLEPRQDVEVLLHVSAQDLLNDS